MAADKIFGNRRGHGSLPATYHTAWLPALPTSSAGYGSSRPRAGTGRGAGDIEDGRGDARGDRSVRPAGDPAAPDVVGTGLFGKSQFPKKDRRCAPALPRGAQSDFWQSPFLP